MIPAEIPDSVIYGEIIHPYEDANPPAERDEDSLRAYFAGQMHQDWPRRRRVDPTVGQCLAIIAGAFAAAVLILVVLAVTG